MAYNFEFSQCLICEQAMPAPLAVRFFEPKIQANLARNVAGFDIFISPLTLPRTISRDGSLPLLEGADIRGAARDLSPVAQELHHLGLDVAAEPLTRSWGYFFSKFTREHPGYFGLSGMGRALRSAWLSTEDAGFLDRYMLNPAHDVDIQRFTQGLQATQAAGEAPPFFLLRHHDVANNIHSLSLACSRCVQAGWNDTVQLVAEAGEVKLRMVIRELGQADLSFHWYLFHAGIFANPQAPTEAEIRLTNPTVVPAGDPPIVPQRPASPAVVRPVPLPRQRANSDPVRQPPRVNILRRGAIRRPDVIPPPPPLPPPLAPAPISLIRVAGPPVREDYRQYLMHQPQFPCAPPAQTRVADSPFVHEPGVDGAAGAYKYLPALDGIVTSRRALDHLTKVAQVLQDIFEHPEALVDPNSPIWIEKDDQIEALNDMFRVAYLELSADLSKGLAVTNVVNFDMTQSAELADNYNWFNELYYNRDGTKNYHIFREANGPSDYLDHFISVRALTFTEQSAIVPLCFTSAAGQRHFGYLVIFREGKLQFTFHVRALEALSDATKARLEAELIPRAVEIIFGVVDIADLVVPDMNISYLLVVDHFLDNIRRFKKPDGQVLKDILTRAGLAPHDFDQGELGLKNVVSQSIIAREITQLMIVPIATRRQILANNITGASVEIIDGLLASVQRELFNIVPGHRVAFNNTLIPQYRVGKDALARLEEHAKELSYLAQLLRGVRKSNRRRPVAGMEDRNYDENDPLLGAKRRGCCARNRCLWIILLILLAIVALILGLYYGLVDPLTPSPEEEIKVYCNVTDTNTTFPNPRRLDGSRELGFVEGALTIVASVMGYFYQLPGTNPDGLVLFNRTDNSPVPCASVPDDPTIPYDTTPFAPSTTPEAPTTTSTTRTTSTTSTTSVTTTASITSTTVTLAPASTTTVLPFTTTKGPGPYTTTVPTSPAETTPTARTSTTRTTTSRLPTGTTPTAPTSTTRTTTGTTPTVPTSTTRTTTGTTPTVPTLPTATMPTVTKPPITEQPISTRPTLPPAVTYRVQFYQGYDPINEPFKGFLVNAQGGVRIKLSLKRTWAVLWEYKPVGTSSLWGEPDFTGAMTIPQYKQFMAGLEGLRVQLPANISEKEFNKIVWEIFQALDRGVDPYGIKALKRLNKDFLKQFEFVKTAKVEWLDGNSNVKLAQVLKSVFFDKVRFYTDGAKQQQAQ